MSTRSHERLTARVFSPGVINSLAGVDPSVAVARISAVVEQVVGSAELSLGDWFDTAFEQLTANYRSEYLYKNTLVSKIIFGRHSPQTSSALVELPVGSSIVDVAVFNGTGTAYEIKTDLDSFSRLANQLEDYARSFEHVYVVTSIERMGSVLREAPAWAGVLGLRRNGVLAVGRPSLGGLERFDQATSFELLRQREALALLADVIGFVPDVPRGDLWRRCKELFLELPVSVAHAGLNAQLKKRGLAAVGLATAQRFPASLRALAYATELSASAADRLRTRLDSPISHIGVFPEPTQ
jgi:hypothetical protein